jgi:uroporphyrinogen-III synthase
MSKPLLGKRIAVAGARKFDELALIIAKQGGEALCRPMMGSVSNDSAELAEVIRKVCEQGADWFVLVTGVGTKALLEKADELGLGERLREILASANIAARGYKTFNALKTLGLKPVIVDDDGTVEGVRRQLEEGTKKLEQVQQGAEAPWNFAGKHVAVQLHGERMPALTDWLSSQGTVVTEISLYFYEEPLEQDIQKLLYEVLSNDVDVVAFTSNTQVKFFFEGARKQRAESFLQKSFNEKVIALSVGSMTTAELKKHGVTRIIVPEHERMGAMVMELVKYYQKEAESDISTRGFNPLQTRTETFSANHKNNEISGKVSSLPVVLTKLTHVIVVGGGKVAERKVKALLEANIKPTVISPELTQGLLELKTQNKVTHLEKRYEATDLQNAQLVIAATNDEAVNKQISNDGLIHKLLCNIVDNPELGNVHTIGTVRRRDLLLTVSSNGKSPSLTRYIEEELEQYFSERYTEVLEVLHTHRSEVAQLDEGSRHQLISELLRNPEPNIQELLKVFSQTFSHNKQNKGLTGFTENKALVSADDGELKIGV